MATKPTPGASDGTYGTELNAFLDISHSADGFNLHPVDSVNTKILTKFLTGTLDGDTSTTVAHGIATGKAKILAVAVVAQSSSGNFAAQEYQGASSATSIFIVSFEDTNIIIGNVGTNFQSQTYRIKIDYLQ